MHIRYVLSLVIGLSLVHPLSARAAAPPPVIISEIQWAGSTRSTADEWIELFNATGSDIDVGGWFLTGIGTSDSAIVLADGTMLGASGTIVIANYDLGHEKTTLAVSPTLVTSAVSIPNTDLSIVLAQPDGLVVDELHDAAEPDYGSKIIYASMERDPITLAWQTATASTGLLDDQLGTPGLVQAAVVVPAEPESPIVKVIEPIEPEPEIFVSPVEAEEISPPTNEPATLEEVPAEPEITPLTEEVLVITEEPIVIEEIPVTVETPVTDETLTEAPIEVVPIEPIEPDVPPVSEPATEPSVEPMPEPTAQLMLNEIVSAPNNGDEWVEIFNPESHDVDLTGWVLKEGSGKQTPLEGTIPALGYSIIKNPQGNLNNNGDQLHLLSPDGDEMSSIDYGTQELASPKSNESLAWDGLAWLITNTPSPAAANIFPQPVIVMAPLEDSPVDEPYDQSPLPEDVPAASAGLSETADGASAPETNAPNDLVAYVATPTVIKTTSAVASTDTKPSSVKKTSAAKKSDVIEISGVLVALPGTFGSQIAFLNGHELYFNKAEWPALALGDEVQVRGTTSTKDGQQRLKISSANDITITGSAFVLPASADMTHQAHGSLVTIEGTIVSREGTKIQLKTSEGTIEIDADTDTDVRWSTYGAERIRVTGILRRASSSFAIWPRSSADIERLDQPSTISSASNTPTTSQTQTPWLGLSLFAGSTVTLGGWYLRYRIHQRKTQPYEQRTELVHVA